MIYILLYHSNISSKIVQLYRFLFYSKEGTFHMEKLKPKLFSVMKTYTREQFVRDVVAGIIVAIIALPLSIALALASGVTPEKGSKWLS